jgi:hypothetical protein
MLAEKSHTGWKAIAARLGLRDTRTARKWAAKYRLPIIFMFRKPVLDEGIFRVWMVNYMEALREKAGGHAEDAHLRGRRQNP